MSNALIGYANAILTGTLAAGSEQAGLTVGNLQTPHGSAAFAWRTAAGVDTSAAGAWFTVDSGSTASAWRVFALARTNLTAAANVRWRVANTLSFGTGYDSGVISAGIVAGIGQSITAASSQVTGRYLRCDIDDGANPDAYISVPLAYAGPAWQPSINYSPESTYGTKRGQQVVRTRSGGTYITPLYTERAWTLAFGAVTAAELTAQAIPADLAAADGRNCLFVPDPTSAARQSDSVFGPLESTADFGFATLDGARRTWRLRITERL
jgi:hypothetical protein